MTTITRLYNKLLFRLCKHLIVNSLADAIDPETGWLWNEGEIGGHVMDVAVEHGYDKGFHDGHIQGYKDSKVMGYN